MNSLVARRQAYADIDSFLQYPKPPPSIKYSYPIRVQSTPMAQTHCKVEVIEGDTLDIAKRLQVLGQRPLTLNMACASHPGGGWADGAAAQEESLFYRSTYYRTLTNNHYPIHGAQIIYSPNVTVFRDSKLNEIEPWTVDFMAVSAVRHPRYDDKLTFDNYYDITSKKIELMFQLAIAEGYRTILLSAFGCGAYKNDPKIIVEIFNKMIKKYTNHFDVIYFGILSLKDVKSRYYRSADMQDNFQYFHDNIIQTS